MKRIVTKFGNVFCVKLEGIGKKYFQYIANDMSQLNSSVIRAFKKIYAMDDNPDLKDVINSEVDFYAHVVLRWGIEKGLGGKIGKVDEVGSLDISFRDSNDAGCKLGEQVKVSESWYIWKINEPFKYVGKLEGENRKAELGIVVNAFDIVDRIRTGKYHFFYPGYE